MKTSQYTSAKGNLVTLYSFDNGYNITVVNGDITCYDKRDEMFAMVSLEAAIAFCAVQS